MKSYFTPNFGLKILALVIAILIWYAVYSDLGRVRPLGEYPLEAGLFYKLVSKNLPVELVTEGAVAAGYQMDAANIVIRPGVCLIIGPRIVLDRLSSIKTKPVNISGLAKTRTYKTTLQPIPHVTLPQEEFVEITIPVEKIPPVLSPPEEPKK